MHNPGDRVERIEDRPQVAATVISVDESGAVELAYDEGGYGWWPADCLRPLVVEG